MQTRTRTNTYTRTRIDVIDDHLEMFLTCAEMSNSDIKGILEAAANKELSAVGIYIEKDGFRFAEVEFKIDWDEHQKMVGVYGEYIDTDQPGWKDGIAPEAYIAAQHLVKLAKELETNVRSWIMVSPAVRNNSIEHKKVCEKLGYSYGSSVSPWKNPPIEKSRKINYLPEAKITQRIIQND